MKPDEYIDQQQAEMQDQIAALTAQNAALVRALDRLLGNSRRIFDKTPVRDWCETLAEAERALFPASMTSSGRLAMPATHLTTSEKGQGDE